MPGIHAGRCADLGCGVVSGYASRDCTTANFMRDRVKSLNQSASSYGSPDHPLRKYIALLEALERVLGVGGAVRSEGQALYLSLVRTWGYYLVRALDLCGAYILYISHNGQIPILFGKQDETTGIEVGRFAAKPEDGVFTHLDGVLMFQVGMVSFRLVGALRRRDPWTTEHIGWTADSLDLLKRVS